MKPFITLLAFLLTLTVPAMAAPRLINYQGRLTNPSGQPITQAIEITFTFWSAETGGIQLGGNFSDSDTVTTDANGIYSTLIGDDPGSQIPVSVFNGDSVWLNVRINGEHLKPRKRIVSVGSALRSSHADVATTATHADTLDGKHASAFMATTTDNWVNTSGDEMTGALTVTGGSNTVLVNVTNSNGGIAKAIQGTASGTASTNYGGYFDAAGPLGRGVYGRASGMSGFGVYGEATAASGVTYGVRGRVSSPSGYAGYFAGRGYFEGNVGIGKLDPASRLHVEGSGADALVVTNTGAGRGATINAPSDTALWANTTNGYAGVDARNAKATGIGVYGAATATGAGTNFGGYFEANGNSGRAVYGIANATSGETYGGYFVSMAFYGRGVQAVANGQNGVGILGSTSGTEGKGVQGFSSGDSGAGVLGSGNIGVLGSGKEYDFYANGAGINYAPFTGAHEVQFAAGFPANPKPGLIVVTAGPAKVRRDEAGQVSISSTLPTVRLADRPNAKAVFGVLAKELPLPKGHWHSPAAGERFGVANALGEGRVWVCSAAGPIEMGDYITTSGVPGYGQKQGDDLQHSYTVGKVIESVDWSTVTETIEHDGQVYKVYLIAVVYTCG